MNANFYEEEKDLPATRPVGSVVLAAHGEAYALPPRLAAYVGARVTVHYANGYSDTGVVTHLDATWVELLKDNTERLLVPLVGVRLIKLLDTPKLEGDAAILLRPAEGDKK